MRLLLSRLDTVEAAYYFRPSIGCLLDFAAIGEKREAMRAAKQRDLALLRLGGKEFLLAGHGTASGYPFLMENGESSIQFGEFNSPGFFVTYRSHALWHKGAQALHLELPSSTGKRQNFCNEPMKSMTWTQVSRFRVMARMLAFLPC